MFRCLPARRSINSHELPNKPLSITREPDNGTFDFCEPLRVPLDIPLANRLLTGAWVSAENRKLDHQHLAPLKSLEFWRLLKMNKSDCEKEAKELENCFVSNGCEWEDQEIAMLKGEQFRGNKKQGPRKDLI